MPLNIKGNIIETTDITNLGVFKKRVNTDGLILYLDAANLNSYPGSGTVWYDLSGKGNNFSILASAYNSTGPKYMDFNGSYGCAKKTDSDVSLSGNVTCICWSRIKNSSTDWRTLLRGFSSGNDHQVIIQSGGWTIGMYDNTNSSGFNSCGYSQQSITGYGTSAWNMLTWIWNDDKSPYYNFYYNDMILRGSITSINSRFKHGVCSIGAYHNANQTDPSNASQYWGDIGLIMFYNRVLSPFEIAENFQAQRGRFGL